MKQKIVKFVSQLLVELFQPNKGSTLTSSDLAYLKADGLGWFLEMMVLKNRLGNLLHQVT